MPERVWYRSLYWRIALGYVALLARAARRADGAVVVLSNRMWGQRQPDAGAARGSGRRRICRRQLTESPEMDVESYLRRRYGARLPAVRRSCSTGITGCSPTVRRRFRRTSARDARMRLRGGDPERGRDARRAARQLRRIRGHHGRQRTRRRGGGAEDSAAAQRRAARAGADAGLAGHRPVHGRRRDHGAADLPSHAPPPAQSRGGGKGARRRTHRRPRQRVGRATKSARCRRRSTRWPPISRRARRRSPNPIARGASCSPTCRTS